MQIQKLFFKVLAAAVAVCLAVFSAVSLFGCENTPSAITSGVLSQGGAEAENSAENTTKPTQITAGGSSETTAANSESAWQSTADSFKTNTTAAEKTTSKSSVTKTEKTTAAWQTKPSTTTPPPTVPAPPPQVTTMTAKEALTFFNDAVKKVKTDLPGYTKTRIGNVVSFDKGVISKYPLLYNAADGFIAKISNSTVYATKGQEFWAMQESTLRTTDMEGNTAGITSNWDGQFWNITLKVKGGTTTWNEKSGGTGTGTATAPIDKGPLYTGLNRDWDYDHQSAQNVVKAIVDEPGAVMANFTCTVSNVVYTAKIDNAGRMVHLTCTFSEVAVCHKVQYLMLGLENEGGSMSFKIEYNEFVW
jgi:hypothetical protein